MKAYKIHIADMHFVVVAENKQTAINEAVQRLINERKVDSEFEHFNEKTEQEKWDTVYEQFRGVEDICWSDRLLIYPGQDYQP